ncbi:MAG: DUF3047 domain-containing protein [Candidatus Deferrimicrobiaceae bacterium]
MPGNSSSGTSARGTPYSLVVDGMRLVLKAHSRGAASGLYKEVALDPSKYPVLRWSWKIGGTIPNGNERTKAINDIWGNRLPQGESLPNAFTSNAVMVAVESGDGKAGTWVTEERNVYEDFRALFGEDPPAIGAVPLMTDTDNTGGEAVAYYGDIFLGPSR